MVPSDSSGRRCGVDSEVVKKPYLLFFNIEKCISPLVPINGCPTPQVCVEECPTKMFFFHRDKCTNGNLNEIIENLICIRDVDKRVIKTCDDVDKLVNSEHCARWYLPSDSRKFIQFFHIYIRICFICQCFIICLVNCTLTVNVYVFLSCLFSLI